jgi:hypothetical protein
LIMEQKLLSLTTEIRDEQQPNYVLAWIRIRLASILLPNKYDLQTSRINKSMDFFQNEKNSFLMDCVKSSL